MKLIVSSPPHWRANVSEEKLHYNFIFAILPAVVFAVAAFGFHALRVVTLAVSSAVLSDMLIRLVFKKKPTFTDGSAILIGLLFAMLMPPSTPYWLVIVGVFLCIFIGKEIIGGL